MKGDLIMAVTAPDFDEYFNIVNEIRKLMLEVLNLEIDIKTLESSTLHQGYTNPKWYVDDKPLPVTMLDKGVRYTGFENEILPLRKKLAEVETDLEYYKNKLKVYHDMVEVYRTESANERSLSY